MRALNCWPPINFYRMPILPASFREGRVFSPSANYTRIHLLKLHGSINWHYSGEIGATSEQIYYSEGYVPDLVPFIIPPVLDKNSSYTHTTLKTLWSFGADYLKLANEIYIIGYSLPETDLPVNFYLQENIRPGAKVYVINKPTNSDVLNKLKERYAQILPEGISLNFDFCSVDGNPIEKFIQEKLS